MDKIFLRALTTRQKRLSIFNKQVVNLPDNLELFKSLTILDLQFNKLNSIPNLPENLQSINLGNNNFTHIPHELVELKNLKILKFYKNYLTFIPDCLFENLKKLELINVNNNSIELFPDSVENLLSLKHFSASGNKLKLLPNGICALKSLEYLNLGYNQILQLPNQIGCLCRLRTFILHKNYISRLPESFIHLKSLKLFDVAGNNLQLLPSKFEQLELREFYAEANPFTEPNTFITNDVNSDYHLMNNTGDTLSYSDSFNQNNVINLKELCLRLLINIGILKIGEENKFNKNLVDEHMLRSANFCGFCNGPFVSWWLECVRFTKLSRNFLKSTNQDRQSKIMPNKTNNDNHIYPLRIQLCSYNCLKQSKNVYMLMTG